MTGIFLLFVIALWLIIAAWLSRFVTRKLPETTWRGLIGFLVFAILLPLPVIDEIVGGYQFRKLCEENSTIQVDREKARGRTLYFDPQPDIEIKDSWIHIVLKPRRFVDSSTSESIVSYNEIVARGGWLIRTLAISEGGMPIMFRGTCVPESRPASVQTFAPLGITYIEPPTK